MNALCVVLLAALATLSTAHYDGYPFVHRNEGRYGAAYPYANYAALTQAAAPAPAPAYGAAYGFNNEFTYRGFGGYPVHVGGGEFYYLGKFTGSCSDAHAYGFYFAGDADSFIVCDHGRSHRFQCPAGTKNRDFSDFQVNHRYGMHQLCGINTNQK